MSGAELECARAAYRGSLEAARAQRAFSPSVRHSDTACWSMLGALFAEPGMNRTMLVGRISQYAGVSRATAERIVSRARATGHIVDQPSGKAVRYFLSQRSFDCCIEYYRKCMRQQIDGWRSDLPASGCQSAVDDDLAENAMIGAGHEQAPALAGATVLVVEDEALVALDLAFVLRDLGCIVLGPAADSAQALALLQRQRPDAVLLDLGLRDGFALALVEALAAAGTPYVLTTGYDCEQLEPALRHAPRLDKPYGREELRRALLRVLGR
jgi:CheY-like chemotaxis protein